MSHVILIVAFANCHVESKYVTAIVAAKMRSNDVIWMEAIQCIKCVGPNNVVIKHNVQYTQCSIKQSFAGLNYFIIFFSPFRSLGRDVD